MKYIEKWLKDNRRLLVSTVVIFIVWQVSLGVVIQLGHSVIPPRFGYLYDDTPRGNPVIIWNRANFDGVHYLGISRDGYGVYQQAFFPFYPWLISALKSFAWGSDLIAGWLISFFSLFVALIFFQKLVKLEHDERTAKEIALYLLIFPTAFFFSMVYTESLFLMLLTGSFYFARTKRWWLAGIFGALASATRLPGIFLFPVLLIEWWQQRKKGSRISELIPIFLIPVGLLWYMRFLAVKFGDPLLFFHVQANFGAGRSSDKLILLYQVFWRYLKMIVTVDKFSTTYLVVILEVISSCLFLFLTILSCFKQRLSYSAFMILTFITPTLTGTLSSMPRYVLMMFPGFMLLPYLMKRYPWVRIAYPLISIPSLIILAILFTRGYWVA